MFVKEHRIQTIIMFKKTVITWLTIASFLATCGHAENWDNILNDQAIDTSGWINPNDMGFGPTPTKNVQKVVSKPELEDNQNEVSQAGDNGNVMGDKGEPLPSSGRLSFSNF